MEHAVDRETLIGVGLMLVAAAFIAYLGYRIRYHGDVELVAGYDPEDVADPDGLAALAGGVAILLGAVTAAFGLGLLVVPSTLAFWVSYVAVVCLAVAVVEIRGRRYAA